MPQSPSAVFSKQFDIPPGEIGKPVFDCDGWADVVLAVTPWEKSPIAILGVAIDLVLYAPEPSPPDTATRTSLLRVALAKVLRCGIGPLRKAAIALDPPPLPAAAPCIKNIAVMSGNSETPDPMTANRYFFSPSEQLIVHLESPPCMAIGGGMAFPAKQAGERLPRAPRIDVHVSGEPGVRYVGQYVVWYRIAER